VGIECKIKFYQIWMCFHSFCDLIGCRETGNGRVERITADGGYITRLQRSFTTPTISRPGRDSIGAIKAFDVLEPSTCGIQL
jgi:hypothetical protein